MNIKEKIIQYYQTKKYQWSMMSKLRKNLVIGEAIVWIFVLSNLIHLQLWALLILPAYYVIGLYLLQDDEGRKMEEWFKGIL